MDVTLSTAVGLAPAAILSGAAFLLYELPASGMIYLPCSLVMLTGLQVTAGMLNVARRYAWSAALLRLPNSMLFLAWIAGEIDPALSSLHVALAFHLATMCFSLFLGLAVLRKSLPRGTRRIPLGQHLSGIAFVGSSLATALPEQGIVAVAGRVLAPAEVAAFAAAAILLRPFRLARSILTGILMPELIRRGRGGYQRYFAALGGLASCAGLIAALVLPPLARWFYGPRYIQAASVIPILAVGGAIHLMTVVQKSDYSGRAPTSGINRYVATLVLGLTAALLLGAVLVARIGVRGAATGVLMAELTEWAVTLGFWLRFRHHETFARSDA
jgi:O-antigen/teichoic acid export membrane protein